MKDSYSWVERSAALDALCEAGCGDREFCGEPCDQYKALRDLPEAKIDLSAFVSAVERAYAAWEKSYEIGRAAGKYEERKRQEESGKSERGEKRQQARWVYSYDNMFRSGLLVCGACKKYAPFYEQKSAVLPVVRREDDCGDGEDEID